MREIKFRGKRVDNGEWVYGDLCQVGHKRFIDDNCEKVRVIPETVGQYTGMCDKNGREIFEFDVVTIKSEDGRECFKSVVVFFDGAFCVTDERDGEMENLCTFCLYWDIEVVE